MFGHGSTVEAHTNFGITTDRNEKSSPVKKLDLQGKLSTYNEFYKDKNLTINSREVNGRLVLDGLLRIYWGVVQPIKLKTKDETAVTSSPRAWRKSYKMAIDNGLDDDFLKSMEEARKGHAEAQPKRKTFDPMFDLKEEEESKSQDRFNTISGAVVYRRKARKPRARRRLSMINGHVFNLETCVFTPVHGSITSVRISSVESSPEVIKSLLSKFKVLNDPREFCLCIVKESGERHMLQESDYPLLERVLMGPMEDQCKIFITEKSRGIEIHQEVAQFVNLPEPVLKGFVEKIDKEEKEELESIKEKYRYYRLMLEEKMGDFIETTRM